MVRYRSFIHLGALGSTSLPFSQLKNAGAPVNWEPKKGGEMLPSRKGKGSKGARTMFKKYAYKIIKGELIFNNSEDAEKINELIN
ncbi:MAG: hypothetical protein QW682_01715, partial [Nitrososphaerota archaeon]